MARHYRMLGHLLWDHSIKYGDLAALLQRSRQYITDRMNGNMPWTMKDVYLICDKLNIPFEEMWLYFPPEENGIAVKKKTRARKGA